MQNLDAASTALSHKAIIDSKPLLKGFYRACYSTLVDELSNAPSGVVLELGSGAGFIKEFLSDAICSDIVFIPGVDLVCSAENLPFASESLAAIHMLNVFHHLSNAELFLREASRCLVQGGKLVFLEPARTPVGELIYRYLHHEEFEPQQIDWTIKKSDCRAERLSVANGALPWIVFQRDIKKFQTLFPELKVRVGRLSGAFSYLLSGGLSYPQLVPNQLCEAVIKFESRYEVFNRYAGLFQSIIVEKQVVS